MSHVSLIAPRLSCLGLQSCFRRTPLSLGSQSTSRRPLSWLARRCDHETTVANLCVVRAAPQIPQKACAGYIFNQKRCFSVARQALARQRSTPGRGAARAAVPAEEGRELSWQDYDPEGGLPLPSGDLSRWKIHEIFGTQTTADAGNWILRLVNYRRQSGSLIDVGIEFPEEMGISKEMAFTALKYLRQTQPDFDETAAGAAWAELEVQKLQDEYLQRAENAGIYQRTPEEEQMQHADTEYKPGDSALIAMRKEGEAKYAEEQRKKVEKEREQEIDALAKAQSRPIDEVRAEYNATNPLDEIQAVNGAGREVVLREPVQKAWLEPVERKPWVKYYEEQATLVKENIIPQMSALRRLGPSALVVLGILGFCYYLHENYTPPPRQARLFPNVPPALATIGTIIVGTTAVALAYRIPPLWKTFNRWFISVPALPSPSSIVLSMFTHQSFAHMFINFAVLYSFGISLHEDVGRGTFLAIFLGSGVTAGFFSLALKVYQKNWLAYSFGSSTAVYGVLAAACLLRQNSNVTVIGSEVPATGLMVLVGFTLLEVFAYLRSPSWRQTVDFTGHFGGLAAGTIAALLIRREAGQKEMIRVEAPKDVAIKDESAE